MPNKIDATITTIDLDKILQNIAEIKSLLPFLIDLSPEDRQILPKMGDKSRAFVSNSLQLAEHDDQYLPRSFDVPEFRRDVELAETLYPISVALRQLSEYVDDTYIQVGSEAYTAALVVYQSAKLNGKGEGLDDLLDALGQRFARKSKDEDDKTPSDQSTTDEPKPEE